jgi:periplasmic protein CpxP/Spy
MARAEAASSATPAVEQVSAPKRSHSRLENLAQKLNLSEEQKSQVAAILKEDKDARREVKRDQSVPYDVMKAKRREVSKDTNAKIRAVLTPEQQVTFDEMQKPFAKKKA